MNRRPVKRLIETATSTQATWASWTSAETYRSLAASRNC
jgi:hypothetical protein